MFEKPRVFLLYSEIAPYRLALFEELARSVDLEVNFCLTRSSKRRWKADISRYSFGHNILNSIKIGPLIFNYLLPFSFRPQEYDVCIIDDDPRLIFSSLPLFLICKVWSIPVIFWSESIGENYFGRLKQFTNRYLFAPFRWLFSRYADSFLAASKTTEKYLMSRGIASERIYVGTQALSEGEVFARPQDKSNREMLRKELGLTGKRVLLFVAYFSKRKGVYELLQAFEQLNQSDCSLVMLGSGEEEKRLKRLAANNENILFPGYLEGQDKAAYFEVADLFILPTFADPWGLVIMEAMMFGLPIITTRRAGASEMIDGNGIIVDPENPTDIAGAIKTLLGNEALRLEMSVNSKKIVRKYTLAKAAGTFKSAIADSLKPAAKRVVAHAS